MDGIIFVVGKLKTNQPPWFSKVAGVLRSRAETTATTFSISEETPRHYASTPTICSGGDVVSVKAYRSPRGSLAPVRVASNRWSQSVLKMACKSKLE
jgi:hypothetical protein